MIDQSDFQSLDDIRLLLQTVKSRKVNFEHVTSSLERDGHYSRINALWKHLWMDDGPDSELARARYHVYQTLNTRQKEVMKSVNDDSRKKMTTTSGCTKDGFLISRPRLVKIDNGSRLLRPKTLLCERCEKKSERQMFRNASASTAISKIAGSSTKTVPISTAKVNNATSEQPSVYLKTDSVRKVTTRPPNCHHRISTKKLNENSVHKEDSRQRDGVAVCLGMRQKNSSKTNNSPSVLNGAIESGNVVIQKMVHNSIKRDLKIQVLPSVDIKSRNIPLSFKNAQYVALTSDDAKDGMNTLHNSQPEALPTGGSSTVGWPQLMRNLPKKLLAACKLERVARQASPYQEIGCQTDFGDLAKMDKHLPDKDHCETTENNGERNSLIHQQMPTSNCEALVRTPIGTPPLTESSTPKSTSYSSHIITPTESIHYSLPSAVIVLNSTSKQVLTPEPALPKSVSPQSPRIHFPSLTEAEFDDVVKVAGDASPKSPISKSEDFQPVDISSKMKSIESVPEDKDPSLEQMPLPNFKFRALRIGDVAHPDHQMAGERSSVATTPEDITDVTNNTTVSVTFSEGEVKPFRSHGHPHFGHVLTLCAEQQAFHPLGTLETSVSSLGESVPEWRRNKRRRPSDLRLYASRENEMCSESEKSLGEMRAVSSYFGQRVRQVIPDTEMSSDGGASGSTNCEWDIHSDGEIPQERTT